MSTSQQEGVVPQLTLGWRLRMARESTGMGLKEFAAHIGVSPDTLTSAEHDRRKVRAITLNAYVLATKVSREWLVDGQADPTPPDDGGPVQQAHDAVAELAQRKRSRHAGGDTDRYYSAEPVAA